MHLDVKASSVERVVELGGRVLDGDSFRWTLMADAEGGELCVFVRDEPIDQPFFGLVIDCADQQKAATWWSDALGGATLLRAKGGDIGWHVMADPEGNAFCAFTG